MEACPESIWSTCNTPLCGSKFIFSLEAILWAMIYGQYYDDFEKQYSIYDTSYLKLKQISVWRKQVILSVEAWYWYLPNKVINAIFVTKKILIPLEAQFLKDWKHNFFTWSEANINNIGNTNCYVRKRITCHVWLILLKLLVSLRAKYFLKKRGAVIGSSLETPRC
jgi:hypothetical protein